MKRAGGPSGRLGASVWAPAPQGTRRAGGGLDRQAEGRLHTAQKRLASGVWASRPHQPVATPDPPAPFCLRGSLGTTAGERPRATTFEEEQQPPPSALVGMWGTLRAPRASGVLQVGVIQAPRGEPASPPGERVVHRGVTDVIYTARIGDLCGRDAHTPNGWGTDTPRHRRSWRPWTSRKPSRPRVDATGQLRVSTQQRRHRLGQQRLDHRVVADDAEAGAQEAPCRLDGPRRDAVDADLQCPLFVVGVIELGRLGRRGLRVTIVGEFGQLLTHRANGLRARVGAQLRLGRRRRVAREELDHRPAEVALRQRGAEPRQLGQPCRDPRRLVDPARVAPEAVRANGGEPQLEVAAQLAQPPQRVTDRQPQRAHGPGQRDELSVELDDPARRALSRRMNTHATLLPWGFPRPQRAPFVALSAPDPRREASFPDRGDQRPAHPGYGRSGETRPLVAASTAGKILDRRVRPRDLTFSRVTPAQGA